MAWDRRKAGNGFWLGGLCGAILGGWKGDGLRALLWFAVCGCLGFLFVGNLGRDDDEEDDAQNPQDVFTDHGE